MPNPIVEKIPKDKIHAQFILCVDDEVYILQSLKRLLRNEGYTILTATNGEEGLNILTEHPQVQVVISDQRMPGMSGSEFLMHVKKTYPDMVRVILSGYAEASAILEAINDGEVYHFLAKPWKDEELKVLIRQCMTHYDLRQENRLLIRKTKEQNDELKLLNSQLTEKIDLSYPLSEEILATLPVPIVGIDQEGWVVLTNAAAQEDPLLQHLQIGRQITDRVPDSISKAIYRVLSHPTPVRCIEPWETEHAIVPVQVVPVQTKDGLRGCILLPETERHESENIGCR